MSTVLKLWHICYSYPGLESVKQRFKKAAFKCRRPMSCLSLMTRYLNKQSRCTLAQFMKLLNRYAFESPSRGHDLWIRRMSFNYLSVMIYESTNHTALLQMSSHSTVCQTSAAITATASEESLVQPWFLRIRVGVVVPRRSGALIRNPKALPLISAPFN